MAGTGADCGGCGEGVAGCVEVIPYSERMCLGNLPKLIRKLAVVASKMGGLKLTRKAGTIGIKSAERVRRGERAEDDIDMFVVEQLTGAADSDCVLLSSSSAIQSVRHQGRPSSARAHQTRWFRLDSNASGGQSEI